MLKPVVSASCLYQMHLKYASASRFASCTSEALRQFCKHTSKHSQYAQWLWPDECACHVHIHEESAGLGYGACLHFTSLSMWVCRHCGRGGCGEDASSAGQPLQAPCEVSSTQRIAAFFAVLRNVSNLYRMCVNAMQLSLMQVGHTAQAQGARHSHHQCLRCR